MLWFKTDTLVCSLYIADIDDCVGQPCQNGATCIDAVNNYTCNCVDGYTGRNCSIGKNRECLFGRGLKRLHLLASLHISVPCQCSLRYSSEKKLVLCRHT